MIQGVPHPPLTIHSQNPEVAAADSSHPQKKQKGRSIRSGLSSLFSVHVRCHCPPVNGGDGWHHLDNVFSGLGAWGGGAGF